MTLMRYVTILCDYCREESDATWSALETRKKATGWRRIKGKDMCPDCINTRGKELGEAKQRRKMKGLCRM